MRKSNRKNLLLVLFIILIGCDKGDTIDNAARLRVKITDATSLVIKEMHVDITEISLFVTDSADADGEWISLEYTGGEYNLLKLMNGKSVQIVDQYFPSDVKIEKMKLLFGNNNRIITNTDSLIQLQKVPEIADGLEFEINNVELMPNVISYIIIDINAALSVTESNGNWFLNPAARAFQENWGASITGYVAPIEANPRIAILKDDDVFFTIAEPDGMFKFIGLEEGIWEIHIMAHPESIFKDTIFTDTLAASEKKELTPKPIRLQFATP
jgi:hypothetical protein